MSTASATVSNATSDEPGGPSPTRKKGKLLLLAPFVLVAVVAGLWFGGVLPPLLGMGPKSDEARASPAAPAAPLVFQEMPDIVANLNGNPRHPSYIKLKARLELARSEDLPRVQEAMPRLMDLFQTYVRELRPEELRGSAGTYRLREELIARANVAASPARVTDVLFTEILVQ